MNTAIILRAVGLGLALGPSCSLHCGLLAPVAAGAGGESSRKGLAVVVRIFLGRFCGYMGVGVLVGWLGPWLSEDILVRIMPYAYIGQIGRASCRERV